MAPVLPILSRQASNETKRVFDTAFGSLMNQACGAPNSSSSPECKLFIAMSVLSLLFIIGFTVVFYRWLFLPPRGAKERQLERQLELENARHRHNYGPNRRLGDAYEFGGLGRGVYQRNKRLGDAWELDYRGWEPETKA